MDDALDVAEEEAEGDEEPAEIGRTAEALRLLADAFTASREFRALLLSPVFTREQKDAETAFAKTKELLASANGSVMKATSSRRNAPGVAHRRDP